MSNTATDVHLALCDYLVKRLTSEGEVSKDELSAALKLVEGVEVSSLPDLEPDEIAKRLEKIREKDK